MITFFKRYHFMSCSLFSLEYVFLQVSHIYILEVEITDNTIEISSPGSDKVETYDASRDIRGENLRKTLSQLYPTISHVTLYPKRITI